MQEAWSEGEEVLSVAKVLNEDKLAVGSENAMRFHEERVPALFRADFMRGHQEKNGVAIGVRKRQCVEAA